MEGIPVRTICSKQGGPGDGDICIRDMYIYNFGNTLVTKNEDERNCMEIRVEKNGN